MSNWFWQCLGLVWIGFGSNAACSDVNRYPATILSVPFAPQRPGMVAPKINNSPLTAIKNLLTQRFINSMYHYSIQFPAGWKAYDRGQGVVVFKGPPKLSVNIQTIYTKKAGGEYATIKDLMDDFYKDVPKHSQDVKFATRAPITLSGENGTQWTGEQTQLSFAQQGQIFRQWQVMVMSRNGLLFQAWAYRAPEQQFAANLPLLQAMLVTWALDN